MGTDKYIVQQANIAFRKKDYALALALWRQAASELGEKNFSANISLTEKLLRSHAQTAGISQKNFPNSTLDEQVVLSCKELPSVSIIIPTYKENEYIFHCIDSALNQLYPHGKIKIIISVNGTGIDYYNTLCEKYSSEHSIFIIYTSGKGLPAARNFAFQYVDTDYLTYLDDDDYFTPGYIKEMASHATDDIDIICGRLVDFHQDTNTFNDDTYINKVLEKSGGKVSDNPLKEASLLSSMCAKLYKKNFIASCLPIDEDLNHTEDVDFWVNNFQNISGNLYLCDSTSQEAYVRRIVGSSMSRPSQDKSFSFYITDRIKFIEKFSRKLFTNLSIEHKRFLLIKIDAQTNHMLKYFLNLPEKDKLRALEIINRSNAAFLNKSKFGLVRGIAFCHNFSPYADASAYVASKRLSQISYLHGQNIYWDVFCALMHTRQRDNNFEMFFARYQYAEKHIIGEKTYFNEKAQWEWGQKAFEAASALKANVIYSRSMWVGSHIAAYLYKQKYPDVKWYAEFSDPVYMGTDNEPRKYANTYDNELSFLNTFWKDIEFMVINTADTVIFTNKNQKLYMLSKNELLKNLSFLEKRSITIGHPRLPSYYCSLIATRYHLNNSTINIGYFGSLYANRHIDDLFNFLKRPHTYLHIFTSSENFILPDNYLQYKDRIKINKQVDYFEFLNIASKMDYLYLNDINFPYEINPYLPSKIADYLMTDTPIIAKVVPNSPLSYITHPNLIFLKDHESASCIQLKKSSMIK